MSRNKFLNGKAEDLETAVLYDKAYQLDIGKAIAYTDGTDVFINTDENLTKLLPEYNEDMLAWLLWHEEMHKQLSHHHRYFDYIEKSSKDNKKFGLTNQEVNIIMDILVHDSMTKMFPDKIATAVKNCAQFRNRNSLKFTFKTNTLEKMLDEYQKHKQSHSQEEGENIKSKSESKSESSEKNTSKDDRQQSEQPQDKNKNKNKAKTEEANDNNNNKTNNKNNKSQETEQPDDKHNGHHHGETDWSKLKDINTREFIEEEEAEMLKDKIKEIKNIKFNLAQITSRLSSMLTHERTRTYERPSKIFTQRGVIMKGHKPGKCNYKICMDCSGSMQHIINVFKQLLLNSLKAAKHLPAEWFTRDYYKGTFEELLETSASSGYNDDGDRVIMLCEQAEKEGYGAIGISDSGGGIYNATKMKEILPKLRNTVIISSAKWWLDELKEINPRIQTIYIDAYECAKYIKSKEE